LGRIRKREFCVGGDGILEAGVNSIQFGNPMSYAPDMDRIVISGNHGHFRIANGELLAQRLESAIVAAMAEATNLKHIERHSGGDFGCIISNANCAFASMNLRISHADDTRSMPGRWRVTQVPLRYSFRALARGIEGACETPSALFSTLSTLLRSALSKKSMAAICWNRLRSRANSPWPRWAVFLLSSRSSSS